MNSIFSCFCFLVAACAFTPAAAQTFIGGCDQNNSYSCSNNGICLANSTCLCNEFWSQHADFVNVQDCPTSVIGIYILWGFSILEILWIIYSTAYVLVARAENFFEQKKKNSVYSLWKNKGLMFVALIFSYFDDYFLSTNKTRFISAVILYFGICLPSHTIMCIIKMINPVSRIGFDIFPTILFFQQIAIPFKED